MNLENHSQYFSKILQCFCVFNIVSINPLNVYAKNEYEIPNHKPNILLIYIDDLGYSDIGCYGKRYGNNFTETPNIDKLAQEGIKFSNAYSSAPLCSPSRAALLTGKSPARLKFEFVTKYEKDTFSWDSDTWVKKYEGQRLIPPPFTLNLPLEEMTLAEMLKHNGYFTGIVGKWHVASHFKRYKGWSQTHGPFQQGFDYASETFGSHPYGYSKDDIGKSYNYGEYPTDRLTENAIEFIKKKHDKPFFLYVSHYYVHDPLDDRLSWLINKYKHKAKDEDSLQLSKIKYAAFIETMDHYVGKLLEALDQQGLSDNTFVIFTSDNGGHPEFAFNRPFRGSKWNLYEGGIRVPLIVRWPNRIKQGIESSLPVIQTDFMPTFYEISGGDQIGIDINWDGISILPELMSSNEEISKTRSFIWHFPYYIPEGEAYFKANNEIGVEDGFISKTTPQSSIRNGKYKLLYFYESEKVELYDIETDLNESNDISEFRPWITSSLKRELFEYLDKVNARYPRINN